MEFVQGLPQRRIRRADTSSSPLALPAEQTELTGFNLALHVKDEAQQVQQHRMMLLDEFAQFGVKNDMDDPNT